MGFLSKLTGSNPSTSLDARDELAAQLAAAPKATPTSALPARKAGKATSYSAKGSMPAPPVVGSETGSSLSPVVREVVPELVSPATRRLVYQQMMNDAGVDVSVRAIKTPIMGAEFFIEPFSDDPNDKIIADFIWANLAGGMSAPFINSIEDILTFFEDGRSILEKVYELRPWAPGASGANSKNYTMLKKLGVRPDSTIKSVDYDDNGGPLIINHTAIRTGNKTEDVQIRVDKALIFTFNRKGGRVDGKSILRTAYPHWYYKTHLYKIDAIQKERHSLGVPKGKLLPGWNQSDATILRTLLRNLRTNEEAYMLLTPNVDVEFAKVEGNLVNVLESADHHNFMIMMNVMAQFLISSGAGSGGRAASATQADIFMKALRYVANYIADVINMYLIPELVVYNFPTFNFPKLCVKNIGETKDLQMLSSAFSNLIAQNGITMDLPTENFLRKLFDVPSKEPNAQQTVAPATKPDPNANGNNNNNNGNGNQKGNVKPGADKSGNIGKSPSSAH